MPSGGWESRQRHKRSKRNREKLARFNEKLVKYGLQTVATLTQGEWVRERLREAMDPKKKKKASATEPPQSFLTETD